MFTATRSALGMSGFRRCMKRRRACAEMTSASRFCSVTGRAKFGSGGACPWALVIGTGLGEGSLFPVGRDVLRGELVVAAELKPRQHSDPFAGDDAQFDRAGR